MQSGGTDKLPEAPLQTSVDDHEPSREERERFKPYFDYYDQVERLVQANSDKFNVDDTYLALFGSVTIRSRTDVGGVEYEVSMSIGRNAQTGLLEEHALLSECEKLRQGEGQFKRIDRFEALHEMSVRYVRVESIDSAPTPKRADLEKTVGRIAEPDRGLLDVLVFAKNLSLSEAARILAGIGEEGSKLTPINRYMRTYKDYQAVRTHPAEVRKLLE
jgi:hypothetical protein